MAEKPWPGPSRPAGMRTPRTRALEIGTAPQGFAAGIDYCAQCGHPGAHQHYEESGPHVVAGPERAGETPFKGLRRS